MSFYIRCFVCWAVICFVAWAFAYSIVSLGVSWSESDYRASKCVYDDSFGGSLYYDTNYKMVVRYECR